jgi:hypothetical protein
MRNLRPTSAGPIDEIAVRLEAAFNRGDAKTLASLYVLILVSSGGSWRIQYDIWNLDR